MEAVAPHLVLLGDRRVDGVGVGIRRKRLVERGVEDGDVRQVGQRLPRGTDAEHVRRVVQRRQVGEFVDLTLDLVGDESRLGEARSPVHDPMADRGERVLGAQVVENLAHSGGVVGCFAVGFPDAFDQPAHGGLAGVEVDQLVLDRGGPGVDDEDLHRGCSVGASAGSAGLDELDPLERPDPVGASAGSPGLDQLDPLNCSAGLGSRYACSLRSRATRPPGFSRAWAWIAVMATVLTMSCTRAPRERSLMGLRSPCSTGPMAMAPALRCTALYVLLPVFRSGKMNTVARPATSEPGSLDLPTAASTAASYWIGPSTARSGRRDCTSSVAVRTLSTSAPLPEAPVEYDSMAMRCSMSNWAAVAAEDTAMSASCSAFGSGLTAQSPYTR